MQPTAPLMAFSLLAASCSSVPRPKADLCFPNVPAMHQKCWNLHDDYTDDGHLKPDARAHYLPCAEGARCEDPAVHYGSEHEMLEALNKSANFSPDSWAAIKAWIKDLRNADGRRGD